MCSRLIQDGYIDKNIFIADGVNNFYWRCNANWVGLLHDHTLNIYEPTYIWFLVLSHFIIVMIADRLEIRVDLVQVYTEVNSIAYNAR